MLALAALAAGAAAVAARAEVGAPRGAADVLASLRSTGDGLGRGVGDDGVGAVGAKEFGRKGAAGAGSAGATRVDRAPVEVREEPHAADHVSEQPAKDFDLSTVAGRRERREAALADAVVQMTERMTPEQVEVMGRLQGAKDAFDKEADERDEERERRRQRGDAAAGEGGHAQQQTQQPHGDEEPRGETTPEAEAESKSDAGGQGEKSAAEPAAAGANAGADGADAAPTETVEESPEARKEREERESAAAQVAARPPPGWIKDVPLGRRVVAAREYGLGLPRRDSFLALRQPDMDTRCMVGQLGAMHRACEPGAGTERGPALPSFVTHDPYVDEGMARMPAAEVFAEARTVVMLGDSIMLQAHDAIECEALRALGAPDAPKRGCESLHLGDMDARGIAIGNSCVHYVTIGTYTDLHTHTADRARKIVEDAFAQADEVHINIGLHYPLHYEVGQVDGYKEDVAQVFEIMQRSAVEGKRAIWWETAAQHFPAEDGSGMYEGWEKADAKGRCFCMPVSDRSPRHTNTRTLLASGNFPDLRVMPYFSLTLPRFDLHHEVFCTNERTLQCCDCTHFCYTIPHWEHVFATLRDVIETEEHTARALASQLGAQARGE